MPHTCLSPLSFYSSTGLSSYSVSLFESPDGSVSVECLALSQGPSSNLVVLVWLLACKGYVLFRCVFPVPATSRLLKYACGISGCDTQLSQRVPELFSLNAALSLGKPLHPTEDLLRKPSSTEICYFWNFTDGLLC